MTSFDDLAKIVDDGTVHVTVETPAGWKCSRPNCHVDYRHEHSGYSTLDRQSTEE